MNDRMKSMRDRWALAQMALKCPACSVIVFSSRDGCLERRVTFGPVMRGLADQCRSRR
jgi:hypothetical protein